mmetsp:Transcript_11577/g.17222  ORF Transcript_11577/g.17222 Transcript_11577/m.17222 type:complete len:320 (-) Transcript_11577:161-1120(-)
MYKRASLLPRTNEDALSTRTCKILLTLACAWLESQSPLLAGRGSSAHALTAERGAVPGKASNPRDSCASRGSDGASPPVRRDIDHRRCWLGHLLQLKAILAGGHSAAAATATLHPSTAGTAFTGCRREKTLASTIAAAPSRPSMDPAVPSARRAATRDDATPAKARSATLGALATASLALGEAGIDVAEWAYPESHVSRLLRHCRCPLRVSLLLLLLPLSSNQTSSKTATRSMTTSPYLYVESLSFGHRHWHCRPSPKIFPSSLCHRAQSCSWPCLLWPYSGSHLLVLEVLRIHVLPLVRLLPKQRTWLQSLGSRQLLD